MKKILFLLLVLFSTGFLHAQDDFEPKWILGGSVQFYHSNNFFGYYGVLNPGLGLPVQSGDQKVTSFDFVPYVGKEINEHWIAGVQVGYGYNKSESSSSVIFFPDTNVINRVSETQEHGFSAGLFGRYTVNPQQNIQFFLQPAISFGQQNSKQTDSFAGTQNETEQKLRTNYFNTSVSPGVAWNPNYRLRILARLGFLSYVTGNYAFDPEDSRYEDSFSSFQANFSLSTFVFSLEFRL